MSTWLGFVEISAMQIQHLDVHDYVSLRSCPFCSGVGLLCDGNCPHYLTAFRHGRWHDGLCPPVFCNGFLFRREALLYAIKNTEGIVCKVKAGTSSLPEIEAFYCLDTALITDLRNKYHRASVPGAKCGMCGHKLGLAVERDKIVCALCRSHVLMPDLKD
jgi:hypothetical protein